MTPQEKAKELIRKFHEEMPITGKSEIESAKQCALIAVDETLLAFVQRNGNMELPDVNFEIRYWKQVKEEIEKL